ncbi:MAG: Branched-chain amino acid transport system carrier protein [Succiniclasticum sp.]|jgi:branched-chain amino acid:cation transporter, LIVCS family
MQNSLTWGKLLAISFVLFSSFFGAGNLLFPPLFGYLAGGNLNMATLGFCITGVGLPLMAVLAVAFTGSDDLTEVARPVNVAYAKILLFTASLVIGPLFAIPRTAAFSYEVVVAPHLGAPSPMYLLLYSVIYFLFSYYVADNESKVINWLGKILTPALLICLIVLFVRVFSGPSFTPEAPQGLYLTNPFYKGFQEGYNTMDMLAGLIFAGGTLAAIKDCGLTDRRQTLKAFVIAGLIAMALLAAIYYGLAYAGAEAHRYLSGDFATGAPVLVAIASEYLGSYGYLILSVIIILACLTTSIGLISSISHYFEILFNHKVSQKRLALYITAASLIISNFGLTSIVMGAIPVLCFLYPIIIALSLLHVCGFTGNKRVFRCTMWIVTVASVFEGIKAAHVEIPASLGQTLSGIPLYDEGFGWLTIAIFGAVVGVLFDSYKKHQEQKEKVS